MEVPQAEALAGPPSALLYLSGEGAPSLPTVTKQPPAVVEFGERLAELGLVRDLLVAGSLATGDYLPGVSDLDLVAVVNGAVDSPRRAALVALHTHLEQGQAPTVNSGAST